MVLPGNSDNISYGRLLRDYFDVASTIGAMESRFDAVELARMEEYHRLLESRRELREQLDRVSRSSVDSDIKVLLDQAFSDS